MASWGGWGGALSWHRVVSWALYPVLRHRALRVLAVAYPVMTTLVVVATGNHYFLDAAAGTVLACVTWAVVARWHRSGAGPGQQADGQHGDAGAGRTLAATGTR